MSAARNVLVFGLGVVGAYLLLRYLGVDVPGVPGLDGASGLSGSAGVTNAGGPGVTKTVTLPGQDRIVTRTETVFEQGATKIVQGAPATAPSSAAVLFDAIKKNTLGLLGPVAPNAIGQVTQQAGGFLETGSFFGATPSTAPFGQAASASDEPLSQLSFKVGDAIKSLGSTIASITPLAGVFAANAASQASSFRGAGMRKQGAILGDASVKTAQFGLGYVPILGAGLSAGLGALAGTYEGQRAVKAVGRVEEQGYTAQKNLVNLNFDNALGLGGGTTHKERVANFYQGVNDRLSQLESGGGTITANDLGAFKQALHNGYDVTQGHLGPYLPSVNSGDLGAVAQTQGAFSAWVDSLKAGQKVGPAFSATRNAAQGATNFAKAAADAKTAAAPFQALTAAKVDPKGFIQQTNSGTFGAPTFVVNTAAIQQANTLYSQVAAAQNVVAKQNQDALSLARAALAGDAGAQSSFGKLGLGTARDYAARHAG